jgi:hypothetical protein
MRRKAFPWRKAANGALLGAILFLTILPYFGWAWHRVLPEHDHVFFGAPHSETTDEIASAAPSSANEPDLCTICTGTQISSGVVHLPGSIAAQVLSVAVSPAALFSIRIPQELSIRVVLFSAFYHPPFLVPLDPPPMSA